MKKKYFKKFIFISRKCVKSDVVLIATVAPTTTSTPAPAKGTTAAADATPTNAADDTAATNGDVYSFVSNTVRYKHEDMINMFGEVGVGMGCCGIVWGELGLEGEMGRYNCMLEIAHNVKDRT